MPSPASGATEGPLAVADGQGIAELRQVLAARNYSVAGLRDALQSDELTSDLAVHLRRLSAGAPLSALIKLFLLQVDVDPDEAKRAVAPLPLDRLEGMGLIQSAAAGVQGRVRLFPHEDLVVAFDREPDGENPQIGADWVTSVDPPTVLLAQLTTRRRVKTALDLGTGCGIQALLAARHCQRVVATDLNPRALNFAAFNARLNRVENIEWRQGSLFEPVARETFDLVVSNPPYVISPESAYLFRDSGHPRDSLCRQIVQEVPAFLSEGGLAHLLISWVQEPDEDWAAPLRGWIRGNGCDSWLLHTRTLDALTHAAQWNSLSLPTESSPSEQMLDRWLDYYRRSGIEAIAFGAVILRRRAGAPNWVRADELTAQRVRGASDHILRVFEAHDRLSKLGDGQIELGQVFAVPDGVRLGQTLTRADRSWVVKDATIRLDGGLGFEGVIDPRTLRLVPCLDGRRALGEVFAEAADAEGIERETFTRAAVPVIRRLFEMGFLIGKGPASAQAPSPSD